MNNVQLYGWCCLVGSMAVRLLVARNRFNRRGLGGLQQFRNFWIGLLVMLMEWVAGMLALCGIWFGLFLLLMAWYNEN